MLEVFRLFSSITNQSWQKLTVASPSSASYTVATAARDGWFLADSPLNGCMGSCHRPTSHRQQTSSDPSSPFSTATAVTVGVTRNTESLCAIPSCGRPDAIKLSLPLVCICPHLSLPLSRCRRPLWTTPLPKRSIPKPDQHRKEIIQQES